MPRDSEGILQEIRGEHELLHSLLEALVTGCARLSGEEHCSRCATCATNNCAEHAFQLIGELLGFMVGHFRNEETTMRELDLPSSHPALFEGHIMAHDAMSEAFSRLAGSLDSGNPLPGLRELHALMESWLHEHIQDHDQPMLEVLCGGDIPQGHY